jgi:hypothetical protein
MSAINPADAFRGDGTKVIMPSGQQTSPVPQGPFTYGGFSVNDDEATTPASAGALKVAAWQVDMNFGGANTRGGRQNAYFTTNQNAPTATDNFDRNYVGMQGVSLTTTGDGGSPSNQLGAYFAMSGLAQVGPNVQGVFNLTASEFNTLIKPNSQVGLNYGIQIASQNASRGTTSDAAINISMLGGSNVTWGTGLLFSSNNGGVPLGTDSDAIGFQGVAGVRYGMNCLGVTLTGGLIASNHTTLTDQSLIISAPSAAIILGSTTAGANTPFIDLYTGQNQGRYAAVRMIASGGTGPYNGNLQIQSSGLFTGSVLPSADGASTSGGPSNRWSSVWSTTGSIQTSDARQKENVADVDADFAFKMLNGVAPRTFKWKDQEEQTRKVTRKSQKVLTQTQTFDEVVREVQTINGAEVAVEVRKQVQREVPVTRVVPVVDANGQQIVDRVPAKWLDGQIIVPEQLLPRVHHVEVTHEVEETDEFTTPAKANVRTHYGFVAQEVEAAVQSAGRTTTEFAGLIKDEETGIYGLRMDQMVPLLWAVVREQQKELAALKAALPAKG